MATSERSLEALLQNALDGFFVIDTDRRFVLFSDACERMTGYTRDEVVGRDCQCDDILDCRDEQGRLVSGALCPAQAVFEGTTDSSRQRIEIRRKDGSSVWVEAIYAAIRNGDGRTELVLGVMRDLSRTKEREDALRQDLFYALNVIGLEQPPLRNRRQDIPLLVQSLIERLRRTHARRVEAVSPAALDALMAYRWPGNIHELAGAVESAFAMGEGPVLQKEELPPEVQGLRPPAISEEAAESLRLDPVLARVEREAILRALKAAQWQRNKAAKLMTISRSRLYRRMEALGIDPNDHP